jgi:hypothetical protein
VSTNANTKLTENTGMQILTEVSFCSYFSFTLFEERMHKNLLQRQSSFEGNRTGSNAILCSVCRDAKLFFFLMDFGPVNGVLRNSVQVHARRPRRKMYQK